MKVLIVHNRYRSPGGEERHVALLEVGLREAGVCVDVFERSSAVVGHSRLSRASAGLMLTYRPGGGGIGEALERCQPDVVHFHNIWPLLTPAALRLAKASGASVVMTTHNSRFACPAGTCSLRAHPGKEGLFANACLEGSSLRCALKNNSRGSWAESIAYGIALETQRRLRMLARWVDAFVAPSVYVARMLELAGVTSDRIRVIPNGVSAVPASNRETRFALFAGRVSAEKGIPALIQASKEAAEVPLAVAGTGPLVGAIRETAIEYLGQLDRSELADALAAAAFTVIPSECHETFPYAALESFAAGKPVIATGVGGLPEIVRDGETGLVVPSGSPHELAMAMRRLWENADLVERLGTRALQVVREEYSLGLQVERTIELYRDLRSRRCEDAGAAATARGGHQASRST